MNAKQVYGGAKVLFALLITVTSIDDVICQSSVHAAGVNAAGSGGSASVSVGQVLFITISDPVTAISHGVQQPWEISVITGADKARESGIECIAYPNPATGYVILRIATGDFSGFEYALCDAGGRLLKRNTITSAETHISLAGLPSSVYFIRVFSTTTQIITFRIIKSN